ncbi:hypothetical protein SAMN05661008_00326 [Alkalithermobacter thermoalcaliphilus JW-YL-7 = DSM 7308]|uniref:Phage minor structural protein n=1 Tax=Alkalithermobacter thermoalcaliphilus JW-YL-7 = DSM 7308 TaxID=1121328 RepID=A0A150FPJ7_CLOPD|nr:hypothetical protein JWYL7_0563 [[Clostridium] paradoxum JW-YL-7 = DSM 7308]SHK49840.1 hypothetical protein SAMN05661008_00326 [[Clostridium] paradoxum JW-YL-7 = DSM 7308]
MQLLINDVDFTTQLKSESLRISREVKDYSADFTLILNSQQASQIQITQDVEILGMFNKPLFGGLISNLSFEYIDEDNIFVEVQCTNYNIIPKRRTISARINQEPSNPNPEEDTNRAGFWIRQYILPLLEEEGVTEGWIEAGVQLAETEIEEFNTKSLKEILDVMAEASGFIWYIDHRKKLYFDSYISTATDHIEEDRIIKANADFRNIRVNQDLSNYANKLFIIGGEYQGEEELPPENLTEDDYIYFVKELSDEIVRMSAINGDSGVWGRVIEDANIKTLEYAEYLADNLLDQFGTPPIELEYETFKEIYVPGDYIYADIPMFGLNMDKFVVDSVEISDNGTYLNYRVRASSRKNNNLPKENFFDYMAKLTRKAKEKGKTIINNSGGSTGENFDNINWIEVSDAPDIENFDLWFNHNVEQRGLHTINSVDYTYILITTGRTFDKESPMLMGYSIINNTMQLQYAFKNFGTKETDQATYALLRTELISIPIFGTEVQI